MQPFSYVHFLLGLKFPTGKLANVWQNFSKSCIDKASMLTACSTVSCLLLIFLHSNTSGEPKDQAI